MRKGWARRATLARRCCDRGFAQEPIICACQIVQRFNDSCIQKMRARQYYPIEFEPLLEPKITATESPLSLDSGHLQTLHQAVTNILQTDLAETIYSQIIDGIPTTESFYEFHSLWETDDHPAQLHECLCDGILEKTRAFRDGFNVDSLIFEPQVCNRPSLLSRNEERRRLMR